MLFHKIVIFWSAKKWHFFFALHPLSPVISATATAVAFVLLHNSRFNFHCYTQRGATPTQESAWKWHCNLSQLVRKITKGIHSCKPASPNRPILRRPIHLEMTSLRHSEVVYSQGAPLSLDFQRCIAELIAKLSGLDVRTCLYAALTHQFWKAVSIQKSFPIHSCRHVQCHQDCRRADVPLARSSSRKAKINVTVLWRFKQNRPTPATDCKRLWGDKGKTAAHLVRVWWRPVDKHFKMQVSQGHSPASSMIKPSAPFLFFFFGRPDSSSSSSSYSWEQKMKIHHQCMTDFPKLFSF